MYTLYTYMLYEKEMHTWAYIDHLQLFSQKCVQ